MTTKGNTTNMFVKVTRKLVYHSAATIGRQKLRLAGVKFEEGLVLHGVPVVSLVQSSHIMIGHRVVLCSWSSYTDIGVNHPVVLRTLAPNAELIIGDDVGISGSSICAAKRVIIGAKTMVGANVTIADTDFHPLFSENRRYNKELSKIRVTDVIVGENVFIGANSIILKGVSIGRNSVIGAGSVVTRNIPENVIAAGNPCRVIRSLDVPAASL